MLANFHTHTAFCDGKNTPEEVVLTALEKGFSAIGFSGHCYTGFDLRYCMQDCAGYIKEINRLKEKYQKDIEIYLGIEEDAFAPVRRADFDYIIGSSHYIYKNQKYFSVDSGPDYRERCLAAFDGDALSLAQAYYTAFCDYIKTRKPDIIGHFDLITKYDETEAPLFLENAQYHRLAEMYITEAAKSGCIFEINTGAMAKGLRTHPYPSEDLLYTLKKLDVPVILSADAHQIETLDFGFEEMKKYLQHIGFPHLYALHKGAFVKYSL